jgi:hypothetical protein
MANRPGQEHSVGRKELTMKEKSRPQHQAKKPGKTIKQKRAEKRAAHELPHASIIPPRHPDHEHH